MIPRHKNSTPNPNQLNFFSLAQNNYSAEVVRKAKAVIGCGKELEQLRMEKEGNANRIGVKAKRKNSLLLGSMISADELFNKVDSDGDGCIDAEEWKVFTTQRKLLMLKNNKEKNKLLAAQEKLLQMVENGPKEFREQGRRIKLFYEKKHNMEEILGRLEQSNLEVKDQILEAQQSSSETPLEIEHFVLVVNKIGLDEFAGCLGEVCEEETYYGMQLDDHYKAHAEDNIVDESCLSICCERLGLDGRDFDLCRVLSYFGERNNQTKEDDKTTTASFVRMIRLWNETSAERLHKALLGGEKKIGGHIHGLKHTLVD